MKKSQFLSSVLAFAFAFAACLNSAHAVLFSPGEDHLLPGTTSAAEPQLAGTVIEDESVPFSFVGDVAGGMISGTIQSRVSRSDIDSTLDFYWRVTNDASSVGPLGSFRLGDFAAPEFNANWRSDGSGDIGPSAGHRFDGANDQFFNFQFADAALQPGQSSKFMLLDTSATTYAKTALMDVAVPGFSRISDSFPTFSPAPVPEPSTVAVAAFGIIGLMLAARRRAA